MINIEIFRKLKLVTILLLVSCSNSLIQNNSTKNNKDSTLLALYMIGSDLEDDIKPRNGIPDELEKNGISKAGAGTNDLYELISTYESLSTAKKNKLNIIIAFGGARKQGWKGIKYATPECLIKDFEDGYFGNDTCYLYSNNNDNMASYEGFYSFLNYINSKYDKNNNKFLQIWDHGSAFNGFGNDTNKGVDLITLKEMKLSLANSYSKFNLIGFDACLMGNFEVAKSLKDYSSYLVASEDLEPRHGWNYIDYINFLANENINNTEELGKKLVDSFLDSKEHKESFSKNKTMSLINLTKIDSLSKNLDDFILDIDINKFDNILSAITETQYYGTELRNENVYSIDFLNFIENIKNKINNTNLTTKADNIIKNIKNTVVYSRHDDNKPNSNGLSIYSLNKNILSSYEQENSVSKAWFDFSNSFISYGNNDLEKPYIKEINSYLDENKVNKNCDKNSTCFEISDNLGLKKVEQILSLKSDDKFFTIGSNSIKNSIYNKNVFSFPIWNGEWFLLCDGSCNNNISIFPSLYFSYFTENGSKIYTSDAILNGENIIFYVEVSKNNTVISEWAVPYTIDNKGLVLNSRNQLNLNVGDKISFYYKVYDLKTKKLDWKKGESITFSKKPEWSFANIKEEKAYFAQAQDYKGNLSSSDIYLVK
ncbi:MAG: clostripain-related cysteine peptidase [Candidatus Sericytochromatia bacterium]